MNRIVLLVLLSLTLHTLKAQIYPIDQFDGQTINTCSAAFFDSGNNTSPYGPNENYTITFCPDAPNLAIQIDFTAIDVQPGDMLNIFDGPTTSAPGFGFIDNNTLIGVAVASAANTSGCLTIQFTSDNILNGNGWEGIVSCVFPCQDIVAKIDSTSPAAVPLIDGYIDICQGETVTFYGGADFPQNGIFYNQHPDSLIYEWTFGDGVSSAIGRTVSHTFTEEGGYTVQLFVTDPLGCNNVNLINQKVRVSTTPIFAGIGADQYTVCIGDTVTLQSRLLSDADSSYSVITTQGNFIPPYSRADSIFLPDGNGVCYETSLRVSEFDPGQTLTDINDLLGICINMEHSYMGDLQIELTCPSGNTVVLHEYQPNGLAGGGTFLGTPIDDDTNLAPGLGALYCWTPTATSGTWAINGGGNGVVLPPGDYESQYPLTSLIGCELNGEWTIKICDNLTSDNGYIFSWGLNFTDSLYPNLETFDPIVTNQQWITTPNTISTSGDSIMMVQATAAGTFGYVFEVTDGFGCTYDTTINITVLPAFDPNCVSCDSLIVDLGSDTTICPGEPVDLDATVPFGGGNWDFLNNTPTTIPDNGNITSSITVNGVAPATIAAGSIASVCIDISHANVEDLDIFLQSPSGQVLELTTDNGGTGDDYQNTCFTPSGTSNITTGIAPFTGNYSPEGSFATLNGSTTNGTWLLVIADDALGTTGMLNSWTLSFTNGYTITYNWTPTNDLSCTTCANPTATPSSTTDYIVYIQDNLGCVGTDTITIDVTSTLAAPTVQCDTATYTTVTFSWNAISGATSYEVNVNGGGWMTPNGTMTHQVTGLVPNQSASIQVRAIGACGVGMIGSRSCRSEPCEHAVIVDSIAHVSCANGMDGTVTVSPFGGLAPFTYQIHNGPTQNNGTFSNLIADAYEIFITDSLGCQMSVTVNITEPDPILNNTTIQQVSCNGASNGSILVNPTGGTMPYDYSWSNGNVGNGLINLNAGQYGLTITDANGCTRTNTYTIIEPSLLTNTISKVDVGCNGDLTGAASAVPNGGVSPYTYLWSNGSTDSTLTGLPAGTYTVTVTDGNSCTTITTTTLTEPSSAVTVTATGTAVQCFGSNNGTAVATASGGAGGYTYLWTPTGQTGATANNLTAGLYTVVATDVNGCTASDTTIIDQPSNINSIITQQAATCFQNTDGSASITASGGTPFGVTGYTFQWSNGDPGNTANNLTGGQTYTVTITDAVGCLSVNMVTINHPDVLAINFTTDLVNCNGGNDGTVTVNPTGGTAPYYYLWEDGSTTAIRSNLAIGNYQVTVTDTLGCIATGNIDIQQPTPLFITTSTTDVLCKGEATGIADAGAAGGTAPYAYQWSDGQTGLQATNLTAGTYQVTLSDANGCQLIDSVTINEPDLQLQIAATPKDIACFGERNGEIDINANGGILPYAYSVEGQPQVNSDKLIGLTAGTYVVLVQDDNACIAKDTVDINEPAEFIVDLGVDQTVEFNGSVTLTPQLFNGKGTIEYQWMPSEIFSCVNCETPRIDSITSELYITLIATDGDNCEAEDDLVIRVDKSKIVFVANAFTPNQDGNNDYLFVQGGDETVRVRRFQVFDRWGSLVFENTDTPLNSDTTGWDGTFNGKPLNPTTVAWIAEVEFADGSVQTYKGSSLVLR